MTAIEPKRLGRQSRDPREEQLLLKRAKRLEALGPNICAHATKWLMSAGRKPPQLTSADVARVVDEVWQQDVMLRAAGLDGRGSLAIKVADIESTAANPEELAGRTVLLLGPVLSHKTRDLFRSAGFRVESSDVDGFQASASAATETEAIDKLVAQEILRAIAEELSPVARELWELEFNHGVTGRVEQQARTGHGERAIRKARKELDAFRLMLAERYAALVGILGSLPVIRKFAAPQPAEAAGGGLLALLGLSGGAAVKLTAGTLTAVVAVGAAIEVPDAVREQRKPAPQIKTVTQIASQPEVTGAVQRVRTTVVQVERREQRQRAATRRAAAQKRAATVAAKKKRAAARRAQAVVRRGPDSGAPAPATAAPSQSPAPVAPSAPSSSDIRPIDPGPSAVGQEFR